MTVAIRVFAAHSDRHYRWATSATNVYSWHRFSEDWQSAASSTCSLKKARGMAIERARANALTKPWGVSDLHPFSSEWRKGETIGEIWFERVDPTAPVPSLLLKILFTSQPLSIQVHPNDAYAHSIGLTNGKTEAWHVLRANPGAKVALGLREHLTPQQLRTAIDDGSIADLIDWQAVSSGDTIFVPAGTIHAIGAGLVIAEIQQRSDATFRLFDFGRGRELQIDDAIAVADAGIANHHDKPSHLSDTRTLLCSNAHFTFEKIDLAPNTAWRLKAEQETWILVVRGSAHARAFDVTTGDAIYAKSDHVNTHVGPAGLTALVAYTGGNVVSDLLEPLEELIAIDSGSQREFSLRNGIA
ncbi:MAG: class I mannose-6-phosphate isomerase [Xanthobacteraceae bacterium]